MQKMIQDENKIKKAKIYKNLQKIVTFFTIFGKIFLVVTAITHMNITHKPTIGGGKNILL